LLQDNNNSLCIVLDDDHDDHNNNNNNIYCYFCNTYAPNNHSTMKFCALALVSLLSSWTTTTTTTDAFSLSLSVGNNNNNNSKALALHMISPGSKNIVAFTTTIHREEVDLESLTLPQLKQMHLELETLNAACTEEGTQTNPECDVDLKDERDHAIVQIQNTLQERTGKNSKLAYAFVDMDSVRQMTGRPWTYPLSTIRKKIAAMELLNCECTEDGNQTDPVCDVQLKDERDAAIETLSQYVKSVENMLATEVLEEEIGRGISRGPPPTPAAICRDARAGDNSDNDAVFDMGEIRDCVDHPGSRSLVVMQSMLGQLEAAHNACTEEGTQTNPECDVEVKAERDVLMESLVSMIHDAKICMDQLKAFAKQGDDLDNVAVEDVMKTVIDTIPNLPTNTKKAFHHAQYHASGDDFFIQI